MRDDSDFGAGIGVTIVVVLIITFAYGIGGLSAKSRIGSDCNNMGQTTILSQVYKCERDE